MQFSDTSNYDGLIQDIDFLLFGDGKTQNADYSIEDRTRNINIEYDIVVAELFKADPNFMWDDTTNVDFPIATMALTADKDHYTLPASGLVIHRIRIKDVNGNWITLTPKSRREFSDSELASTGTPDSYFKIDNAFFPLPVPNYGVAGGVELEFQRGANHFTKDDTTKTPGFNSQFHQILSIGAALRYAAANGMTKKTNYLTNERERILNKIREHYQMRSPDQPPRIRLKKRSIKSFAL